MKNMDASQIEIPHIVWPLWKVFGVTFILLLIFNLSLVFWQNGLSLFFPLRRQYETYIINAIVVAVETPFAVGVAYLMD